MTTKFLDNKFALSKLIVVVFPMKTAFGRFSSLPPIPSPPQNCKFYFYCRLVISALTGSLQHLDGDRLRIQLRKLPVNKLPIRQCLEKGAAETDVKSGLSKGAWDAENEQREANCINLRHPIYMAPIGGSFCTSMSPINGH